MNPDGSLTEAGIHLATAPKLFKQTEPPLTEGLRGGGGSGGALWDAKCADDRQSACAVGGHKLIEDRFMA